MSRTILVIAGSLISGALQESFSIPISGALFFLWIIYRKKFKFNLIIPTISYWAGTLSLLIAPGNLYHAAQGGGFTLQAIIIKIATLLRSILTEVPSITIIILLCVVGLLFYRKKCRRILSQNLIIAIPIVVSLLFASLTFTASRQLTLPSILSGMLILRTILSVNGTEKSIFQIKKIGFILPVVYIIGFFGIYSTRQETYEQYSSLHSQAQEARTVIVFDKSKPRNEVLHRIFKRFDYDRLPVVFDGYTKRGLSRLYFDNDPTAVKAIIPTPLTLVNEQAIGSRITDDKIETAPLCDGYRCFFIPIDKTITHVRDQNKRPIPYERLIVDNKVLIIIPDTPATHILTYTN